MAEIINPFADEGPVDKHITLKTRDGQSVSTEVTLQDQRGRQSAAEYLYHLYTTIKNKLDEPVLDAGGAPAPDDQDAMQRMIIYIAGFHDSMFGTFNQRSELPDDERNEFIEIFLLACATVLEGRRLTIDLARGRITNELSLD